MSNGKVVGVLVGGIGLGAALGAGIAMNLNKGRNTAGSSQLATCSVDGGSEASSGLFELDGKAYTRADLPSEAQDVIYQIESQSFMNSSGYLRELAVRVALAKEKDANANLKELPPLKDLIGVGSVSEAEVKKFYDDNKKSFPPTATYEQIKPQLEQYLVQTKVGEATRNKTGELEKAGRLKLIQRAPVAPVVNLDVSSFPSKGPEAAPVTLVEVTDYLCPHCREAGPEVDAIAQEHGDKLRIVQVNFALRPQGLSGALVRGGFCAQKQSMDGFWKYHANAFKVPYEAANSTSPNAEKEFNAHAVTAAKDAGLDLTAFETCLTSDEAKGFVEKTNNTLSGVGVSGTPTFFVNNRKVAGGTGAVREAVQAALQSTASNPGKAQ